MSRQKRYDPVILDRMAEILENNFRSPGFGNDLDAIAWYARTLGRNQNGRYRELLQNISAYPSLDKKLAKHVNKALQGK